MHFGTITTLLACNARSTVPRQRNAPVQNPLLLLRLINTLGSRIAVGCFRHRSPPDCEFAPHRRISSLIEGVMAHQALPVWNAPVFEVGCFARVARRQPWGQAVTVGKEVELRSGAPFLRALDRGRTRKRFGNFATAGRIVHLSAPACLKNHGAPTSATPSHTSSPTR
jgi:hypothetical protein